MQWFVALKLFFLCHAVLFVNSQPASGGVRNTIYSSFLSRSFLLPPHTFVPFNFRVRKSVKVSLSFNEGLSSHDQPALSKAPSSPLSSSASSSSSSSPVQVQSAAYVDVLLYRAPATYSLQQLCVKDVTDASSIRWTPKLPSSIAADFRYEPAQKFHVTSASASSPFEFSFTTTDGEYFVLFDNSHLHHPSLPSTLSVSLSVSLDDDSTNLGSDSTGLVVAITAAGAIAVLACVLFALFSMKRLRRRRVAQQSLANFEAQPQESQPPPQTNKLASNVNMVELGGGGDYLRPPASAPPQMVVSLDAPPPPYNPEG